MSHYPYNRYTSGNQSSNQGQYGGSTVQSERDPRRGLSHIRPEANYSSSAHSSVAPESSGRILPSLMCQSLAYRPEQSRPGINEDIERSVDMHISRAREEVRVRGKPTYQFMDQHPGFASSQREEFCSSGTQRDDFRSLGAGKSYSMSSSSTSIGHRHSDLESGSRSLDWLTKYEKPTSNSSEFYSSSVSPTYASSGDGCFSAQRERGHDQQSIPGLGDYDSIVPEEPAAQAESIEHKYSSQSAADILLHFGLEKEDLEHLISYPEDQITPANLPFILRQIRIDKTKKTATVGQSKPFSEPQPTRSTFGMDRHNLSTSRGIGDFLDGRSSIVPQPSKVIDYGHTSRYTGGVVGDIQRTSNSSERVLPVDTYDSYRQGQGQLQKDVTDKKSSAVGSTHDQASSATSLGSSYRSVLNPVTPPSTPNQNVQTVLGSFSLQKKDTDVRGLQSETSKPIPLEEPKADQLLTSKIQPPSHPLQPAVRQVRTGIVLFDSKNRSGTKGQAKAPGEVSTEEIKKSQFQQQTQMQKQSTDQQLREQKTQQQTAKEQQLKQSEQPWKQSQHQAQQRPQKQSDQLWKQSQQQAQQQAQKQMEQTTQQVPQQPVPQTGQATWPPVYSPVKPGLPAPAIPGITNISQAMRHPAFLPGGPRPPVQPVASLASYSHLTLATSCKPAEKVAASKTLPDLVLMHDYAAATPRIFPHTCSLCHKECTKIAVS